MIKATDQTAQMDRLTCTSVIGMPVRFSIDEAHLSEYMYMYNYF